MKYLCLVYMEAEKLHAVPDSECMACGDGFRERGLLIAAEALQPIELFVIRPMPHQIGIRD